MTERRTMKQASLAAGLAALAISALLVWSITSATREAAADPALAVGLDFNTAGTPANGVYNPLSLPTYESCGQVTVGSQISIDFFGQGLQQLIAFSTHIDYDEARLRLVGSQVKLFMNSQTASDVANLSQNGPD